MTSLSLSFCSPPFTSLHLHSSSHNKLHTKLLISFTFSNFLLPFLRFLFSFSCRIFCRIFWICFWGFPAFIALFSMLGFLFCSWNVVIFALILNLLCINGEFVFSSLSVWTVDSFFGILLLSVTHCWNCLDNCCDFYFDFVLRWWMWW